MDVWNDIGCDELDAAMLPPFDKLSEPRPAVVGDVDSSACVVALDVGVEEVEADAGPLSNHEREPRPTVVAGVVTGFATDPDDEACG